MNIPLVDISADYKFYQHELLPMMQACLQESRFIMGPQIVQLETQLASLIGVKHCICVSNGTDALQIALRALSIGQGDQVITSPFSWIASAEVIPLVGATPVFADIDPDTFNITPSSVLAKVTVKTRAVIAVSIFGRMADIPAMKIALEEIGRTDIKIIEDGAQSLGARLGPGLNSCAIPDTIGCTSFFPTKTLGCYGDGGAVFTSDDALAETIRAIRVHGKRADSNQHQLIGLNGRLDTIQATVLLCKLPYWESMLQKRISVANLYQALLGKDPRVVLPQTVNHRATEDQLNGFRHVYGVYTIKILHSEQARNQVAKYMKEQGVAVAVYYPTCIHLQPAFEPYRNDAETGTPRGPLPVAEAASTKVLSLPVHPFLTEEDQKIVTQALIKALDLYCGKLE